MTAGILITVLAVELVLAFFCSYIAGQKNRDRGGWFVLGFLFGILALIAIAGVPALPERKPEVAPDTKVVPGVSGSIVVPEHERKLESALLAFFAVVVVMLVLVFAIAGNPN